MMDNDKMSMEDMMAMSKEELVKMIMKLKHQINGDKCGPKMDGNCSPKMDK